MTSAKHDISNVKFKLGLNMSELYIADIMKLKLVGLLCGKLKENPSAQSPAFKE